MYKSNTADQANILRVLSNNEPMGIAQLTFKCLVDGKCGSPGGAIMDDIQKLFMSKQIHTKDGGKLWVGPPPRGSYKKPPMKNVTPKKEPIRLPASFEPVKAEVVEDETE